MSLGLQLVYDYCSQGTIRVKGPAPGKHYSTFRLRMGYRSWEVDFNDPSKICRYCKYKGKAKCERR